MLTVVINALLQQEEMVDSIVKNWNVHNSKQ